MSSSVGFRKMFLTLAHRCWDLQYSLGGLFSSSEQSDLLYLFLISLVLKVLLWVKEWHLLFWSHFLGKVFRSFHSEKMHIRDTESLSGEETKAWILFFILTISTVSFNCDIVVINIKIKMCNSCCHYVFFMIIFLFLLCILLSFIIYLQPPQLLWMLILLSVIPYSIFYGWFSGHDI